MNTRPTPETDAAIKAAMLNEDEDHTRLAAVAHKLERERDEAREENEAMREAVTEACPNFSQAMRQWRMYAEIHNEGPLPLSDADHMEAQFFKQAQAALAKLQPFIKP